MSAPSAAEQRLKLRTELRKARTRAGLSQRQVAKMMEWSPSKLLRIESGEVSISVNDLRPLLAIYEISDRRKIDALLDLARGSRKMPFSEYRDVFRPEFLQFLALEASAAVARYFNSLQLPRLLQTEEYARAIATAYGSGPTLSDVDERRLEAQISRQDMLQAEDCPELFFILDEAVLHRQIGGPGVMRAQLQRLAELSKHPKVTIRVVPYTVGAHPGIQGPFTLFEFASEEMPDSLYLETPRNPSSPSDKPEETRRFLELFWQLEDLSVSGDMELLMHRLIQRMDEGHDDLAALLEEPSQE
ncbi:helix-turn-helix domain-containing protein [Actinospica acidiphila]|uniref:helix-turn-helix domain-containing protein n=1 Tax=Streptomyces TaxID=1883 RepID=UPI000E0C6CCD|nr:MULTISPECIES: helix-turn-helix transcriptional regulator [unclassified Streptomyces]AXI84857.1 transcriptional regulator [Streptomyces sp. ETH9427]MBQ0974312.1 helix-turn-helix transcriptional regulator [Streptomyces sp. RK31]NEA83895.1 helix-turn-helix domain-containing protein [Actinospica acidiphila]